MSASVTATLGEFKPDDMTDKVVRNVFKVIPFSPPFHPYFSVEQAAQALYPNATPDFLARAKQLSEGPEAQSIVSTANAIDYGDTGITIYTGLKTAMGLFFGKKEESAVEADPQQGADTVVKALGIAWMIHKGFVGTEQEKLVQFQQLPAGQLLALYFASCELALPFADNLLKGGGDLFSNLLAKHGDESAKKFALFAGSDALNAARSVLTQLTGPLQQIAGRSAQYIEPVAKSIGGYLPGALSMMDKATGIAATGLDALPIYRLLGARLAVEASLMRAVHGR